MCDNMTCQNASTMYNKGEWGAFLQGDLWSLKGYI